MRNLRSAILLAGVAAVLAGAVLAAHSAPVVTTSAGSLRGVRDGDSEAFLGLPYAQPPVGDLRWRPPQPTPAWTGVRDASHFGANCYQGAPVGFGPYTPEYLIDPAVSEDCVYLNVWRPARRHERLPVLVFIHGGGFGSGSGSIPIYNGSRLAERGLVVVNLNYRLGPFGFLAHPELSAESPRGVSGNYGLLDIIAALQWVRGNIAAFGGDPGRVTIAGQSAGASAVNDLLVSPDARGLFSRAIAESGSGMGLDTEPLKMAEQEGLAFANHAHAASIREMRALSPAAVLAAVPRNTPNVGGRRARPEIQFQPVIDGRTLPSDPDDGGAPVATKAPLITGFNANEGVSPSAQTTAAQFEQTVRDRYGAHANRFLALYPHADDREAKTSAALMARDRYMASLVIWAGRRMQSSGEAIFGYLFEHPVPTRAGPDWGTFHTAEVPYVFGVLDPAHRPYGEADARVSRQMSAYWADFVRSGEPNGPDLPRWSPLQARGSMVMGLGDRTGPRPAVSSPARMAAFRDFVDSGGHLSLF